MLIFYILKTNVAYVTTQNFIVPHYGSGGAPISEVLHAIAELNESL
jgi:hypothetical protein